MAESKRIGLIGLDTSHVTAFTELLNDPQNEYHVPGGRVSAAFPGGSADWDLSRDRVAGFTETLRDKWNVKIEDTIEAVADAVDLIFIESVDGRVHRAQFDQVIKFGKPIYIDKPLALSLADARHIFESAARHAVPVMSSSALRYCDVMVEAIGDRSTILGADVYGPMDEQPTQPGLFWYGIHSAEMLVTAMGTGCAEVVASTTGDHDLLQYRWKDGRLASLRGLRNAHWTFGMTIHRKDGPAAVSTAQSKVPFYASLLREVMNHLPNGRSAIPAEETLEVIRIIEASNESRRTGQRVALR